MGNDQLKKVLLEHCYAFIDARIQAIQASISAAQESANDETKSSAGDKYETGRAMMQLEIEQNLQLLKEANKQRAIIDQIISVGISSSVRLGSIVLTDNGNFFISISVGQAEIDGKVFLIVSAQSPIGAQMIGKQVGDHVSFAKKVYKITHIV